MKPRGSGFRRKSPGCFIEKSTYNRGADSQEYGGAVNTGTSTKVQYNYTEMSGAESNSRLRSMVYPNGRILDYQYNSGQEPVSGITSTTTATATTVVAHGLSIGDKVMIEGAGSHYDGLVTVASVPTSTTFTFTIASFTGSSSGTDITEAKFGIDNSISRVSGLEDRAGTSAGTVLEGYSYLGLGTIVIRNRPEDSTQLTYVQQSGDTNAITDGGDQYTGLDRFGRVIDQYWLNTSTSAAVDRFQYSYDRDGNVLYKKNLVNSSFSELYHANSSSSGDNASAYDNINRLTGFRVGTLSSSGHNGSGLDTVSTLNTTPHIYQETWTLDALGNWSTLAQNSGSAVSNSFDKRNRETGFQGNTLTFDNNGNTTIDQSGQHYTYDAWNKVTTIKDSSNTTTLLTETHDALGRVATFNNTAGLQHWYYSNQNQVLEDQFSSIRQQYVWGQGYVNDLVLRDRNTDANTSTGAYGKASSGLEERLYAQQDANYNVTTIIDPTQSIKERFVYDPYGGFTNLDSSWATYTDTTWLWSYKFQGTYWEGIAGFYYMGARLYSPVLGRFLTEDPSEYIDSANLYKSFRDSPVGSCDPSGTVTVKVVDGPNRMKDKADGFNMKVKVSGLKSGNWYAQVWNIRGSDVARTVASLGTRTYTNHFWTVIDVIWPSAPVNSLYPKWNGGWIPYQKGTEYIDEVTAHSSQTDTVVDDGWNADVAIYDLGTTAPAGIIGGSIRLSSLTIPGVGTAVDNGGDAFKGISSGTATAVSGTTLSTWGFNYDFFDKGITSDRAAREDLIFSNHVAPPIGAKDMYVKGGKVVPISKYYPFTVSW